MARLIDADALIERLEKHSSYDLGCFDEELDEIIKTQPTAYNVEKVVDELQSYKQGNCTNDCEHFDNGVKYGYEKGIDVFARNIKKNIGKYVHGDYDLFDDFVEDIAKRLKAGVTNGNPTTDS